MKAGSLQPAPVTRPYPTAPTRPDLPLPGMLCNMLCTFTALQVVLPMLYNDVVTVSCTPTNGTEVCAETSASWMTSNQFYAGLALAQAMPGPLFNFAAYLGACRCAPFMVMPMCACVWVGGWGWVVGGGGLKV